MVDERRIDLSERLRDQAARLESVMTHIKDGKILINSDTLELVDQREVAYTEYELLLEAEEDDTKKGL